MEKLQNKLSDNNLRELKQITLLIDEFCKPDLVVLFGKYADTAFQSVCGGYELLVVSDKLKTEEQREALLDFIRLQYPIAERFEQKLFIHSFTPDLLFGHLFNSVFFQVVLTEGIELRNAGTLSLEPLNLTKKHSDGAEKHAQRCLYFADTFLKDAEAKKTAADCRLCGIYLYYGLEMTLTALEYRYYGFRREYENVSRRFHAVKHASRELNDFYEEHRNEVLKMFKGLKKFRDDSLFCESYGYQTDTIFRYMDIINEMKRIITG